MTDDILLFQQEKTILDVTELICGLMIQLGVSNEDLANLLKMDTKRLKAILSGAEDLTIRLLSDMCTVLNVEFASSWKRLDLTAIKKKEN